MLSESEWLDLGQSTVWSPEKLGNFYRFLAFGEEYPYTTISGEVGWGCYILPRLCIYIYMIICVLYINLVHIVTSIGNSWHLQSATAAISVSLKSSPFAIISNKYSSLNSNGSNTDVKQKGKPVSLRSHQLHSLNSLTQLFSNATVKATQGSLLASDCLTSSLNLKVLNFTNDLSCHSPTPQWQIQSVNWLYPFL